MRILCLGLDGADYDLVCELLAQGRLPTIARPRARGAFGPLRSTIPAVTPTAWSSFLTGLNPAGSRHLQLLDEPEPQPAARRERREPRRHPALAAARSGAGIRSAFVSIPFTYPAETFEGIVVTGYGGPERPQIIPEAAARADPRGLPGLVTAHHPMAERWWEDFDAYAGRLVEHVDGNRRRVPDRARARARARACSASTS